MKRREFLKGAALVAWAGAWCIPILPDMLENATLPTEGDDEEDISTDEELIANSPTHPYFLVNGWAFEDYLEDSHPTRPA